MHEYSVGTYFHGIHMCVNILCGLLTCVQNTHNTQRLMFVDVYLYLHGMINVLFSVMFHYFD